MTDRTVALLRCAVVALVLLTTVMAMVSISAATDVHTANLTPSLSPANR